MATLLTGTGETEPWYRLVMEAEQAARHYLPESTESYLVFLLMRYLRRPDLLRRVMALTYLRAMLSQGRLQQQRLQDVGDQCLILAGLFPGQAERRRVDPDYFVSLGRGAYYRRAVSDPSRETSVYASLANDFPGLIRVLRATRRYQQSADLEHMLPTGRRH